MSNLQKKNQISLLTLIKQTTFGRNAKGLFVCECGNIKELPINAVRTKNTRSCGCIKLKNSLGERTRTHGLSNHPLYDTWNSMVARCHDESRSEYKYYGARGIIVCDEWRHNPKSFIEWAVNNGWQKGMKIDKDIKGGLVYSPGNCTIVTAKINSNHTRSNNLIEYKGEIKTLQEWCDMFNVYHRSIRTRLKRGWDFERAILTPVNNKRYGTRK